MKIWAIEQGCYADYRVVGVFSSRENAQRIVDEIKDAAAYDPQIVEWELDPAIHELNAGMKRFCVHMRKDGSTEWVNEAEFSTYNFAGSHHLWERTKAPAYQHDPEKFPDLIDSTVWANDPEHAIKIVNEVRLQWIAEGKF